MIDKVDYHILKTLVLLGIFIENFSNFFLHNLQSYDCSFPERPSFISFIF